MIGAASYRIGLPDVISEKDREFIQEEASEVPLGILSLDRHGSVARASGYLEDARLNSLYLRATGGRPRAIRR